MSKRTLKLKRKMTTRRKLKKIKLTNQTDSKIVKPPALTGDALQKLDNASSLPKKDGKRNNENYDKWSATSLRKRLWDRMVTKQCVRCGSNDHLRSACTTSRASWEDDFDTGPTFWTPKQARAQLLPSCSQHSLVLSMSSDIGMIAVDTFSDVSLCFVG